VAPGRRSPLCNPVRKLAVAKIRFNADVFWAKVSIGQDTLDLWLDTYQLGKDLKRRGIGR
jgi:hypothetical protein